MTTNKENSKMNQITTVNTLPEEFREIATILQLDAQLSGDYSTKAVDARSLHKALSVGKDFSNWIKYQIERCMLAEDEDYCVVLAIFGDQEIRGKTKISEFLGKVIMKNPAIEYHLTIESAKKIAVLSQTATANAVWKYFLFMERTAQAAIRGDSVAMLARPLPENSGTEERAAYQMDYLARALQSAMAAGGWSEGYRQKQVFQIAEEVDRRHGTSLKGMLPPPSVALPGTTEEIDPTKGFHAMYKQIGGEVLSKDKLLESISASGISWDQLMLHAGYVVEVKASFRKARRSGLKRSSTCPSEWATQQEMTSGYCAGQPKIIAWHVDMIPNHIRLELKELAERLGKKK